VTQFNDFTSGSGQCTDLRGAGIYTVITVDQPSFSLVSTLADSQVQSDVVPKMEFAVK